VDVWKWKGGGGGGGVLESKKSLKALVIHVAQDRGSFTATLMAAIRALLVLFRDGFNDLIYSPAELERWPEMI